MLNRIHGTHARGIPRKDQGIFCVKKIPWTSAPAAAVLYRKICIHASNRVRHMYIFSKLMYVLSIFKKMRQGL